MKLFVRQCRLVFDLYWGHSSRTFGLIVDIYITVANVYIFLKFRICLLPVVHTVKDASELSISFK